MPRSRSAATRLTESASVFAALGDPARLQIVSRLCRGGPLPIVRLTDGANISRQAISKHLDVLSAAGLVSSERSGRERIWRLHPRRIAEVQRCLEQISRQWDTAIGRLQAFVEVSPD